MDARIFRDGVLEQRSIPLGDLHDAVTRLGPGAWLWVDGVEPAPDELALLQSELGLHDLAVEDVSHRNQRPKLELYPQHAFAVFRPLRHGPRGVEECELFVFASPRFLVTLETAPALDLEAAVKRWPVLASLAPGPGGALYAIVDEIVDDYLEIVEVLEDEADDLEARVFDEGRVEEDRIPVQVEILRLRRNAVRLRRLAVPTRQAIDRLADDSELVTQRLFPYLRDVTDHLIRAIELTDGVREILTTIVDIRTAQSANRLNEVMKKLSAWAGIILVPTLIAGIYGMNFDRMPELHWTLGYPMALGLMAASALGLYLMFRRRGWL